MIPARISPTFDAIVDRLRETPRPADRYVVAHVWMPELEDESAAWPLRLKGLRAIAAARHALAVGQGAWPRRIEARVIVRDSDWNAHAFDVRFVSNPTRQAVTAVRCCRVCGCTEDRACAGGCSWHRANLCSACAES